MWRDGDFINLNGSISFSNERDAIEVRDRIIKLYSIKFPFEVAVDDATKSKVWTIDFCHNHVNPLFKNVLIQVSDSYKSNGTLTYIFNERLEAGILRNGDLNIFQPRDLIAFGIDKMKIPKDEVSLAYYDRIKQHWFFYIWGISED